MLPASGVGLAGVPSSGAIAITCKLDPEYVSSLEGSLSQLWSPRALMTSSALSSVRDRGRLLCWAMGSAIVVSVCLRAGTRYGAAAAFCCLPWPGSLPVWSPSQGWV